MSKENPTVVEQLIKLAETPEQVQYLTGNNQDVLQGKVQMLNEILEQEQRAHAASNTRNSVRADSFLEVIKLLTEKTESSECWCD
jgi:hypothetical protein